MRQLVASCERYNQDTLVLALAEVMRYGAGVASHIEEQIDLSAKIDDTSWTIKHQLHFSYSRVSNFMAAARSIPMRCEIRGFKSPVRFLRRSPSRLRSQSCTAVAHACQIRSVRDVPACGVDLLHLRDARDNIGSSPSIDCEAHHDRLRVLSVETSIRHASEHCGSCHSGLEGMRKMTGGYTAAPKIQSYRQRDMSKILAQAACSRSDHQGRSRVC
ncbi:hypothetical protein FB567DRAFT_100527 [Paraphoma chrysanthemicola]|uniref:Uncharacterized protein n=1 Tax=Paraphoma chrysanthemicola TaxID=798071 RepID=A0A8K0R165_9PLEO|nr:hypothetical protein FB567DRAFT_100527 [Paraphoma chrysanthemicola]